MDLEKDLEKLNALIYYQITPKISLGNWNFRPYWSKNDLSRSWTLVEEPLTKIDWNYLSLNNNLEEPPPKIDWKYLSLNNNFVPWKDYEADPPKSLEILLGLITKRCSIYKEELMQKVFHPSRIEKYLDEGIEMEELDNYI